MQDCLNTRSVKFRYPKGELMEFPDLHLQRGEELLVLGPSGRGKTSLLHLLCGFLDPTEGEIEIDGENLHKLKGKQRDKFRARHIGLIFQKPYFLKSLTAWENLTISRELSGEKLQAEEMKEIAAQLGISHKLNSLTTDMSAGEQQRLSITRALINRPDLLLADEPTSALDDDNTEKVASLLRECASNAGAALLVVTHDHRLKRHFKKEVIL